MRYDQLINEPVVEAGILDKIKDLWTQNPAQAAMQDAIRQNQRMMYDAASRYTDPSGKLIGTKAFNHTPLRALYTFMRGPMELDNKDIDWVLRTASRYPATAGLTSKMKLNAARLYGDSSLSQAWDGKSGALSSAEAKSIIDDIIQAASIRRQEKHRMRTVDDIPPQTRTSTAAEPDIKGGVSAKMVERITKWKPGDTIKLADGTIKNKNDPMYNYYADIYKKLQSGLSQGMTIGLISDEAP